MSGNLNEKTAYLKSKPSAVTLHTESANSPFGELSRICANNFSPASSRIFISFYSNLSPIYPKGIFRPKMVALLTRGAGTSCIHGGAESDNP